ncbi:MAG: hypothetical protein LBH35_09420 [Treponema sp.]|jgi:hypothetical protein|nr:hypothetical protein [Treponema sp.]
MKALYKRLLFASLLICLLGIRGFALDIVEWQAPVLTGPMFSSSIQNFFSDDFGDILKNEVIPAILESDPNPRKLIQGFADASVFASTGASQRAYEGYKYLAFTIGPMIGLKLPGARINADEFSNFGDTLKTDGDIAAGLNVQAITGQLSINTSAFLLENLYLGLRFGYFNFEAVENLTYNTLQLGIVGNYRIVRGVDFGAAGISWRGVGLGSGVIFQKTNLTYRYTAGTRATNFSVSIPSTSISLSGNLQLIDPELAFDMNVTTFVVPLEVNTAFQLLFFNISLGLGLDFAFGGNDMHINMDGAVAINAADASMNTVSTQTQGRLAVDAGGSFGPAAANPKLMMGLGFKFGRVVFDIPVTYFFLTGRHGLALGITLGIVW